MSPTVVQFLHPGREHLPRGPVMDWNRGAHRRKFLRNPGRCIRGSADYDGQLTFWGEWEPQSTVEPIESPLRMGPRFVQAPFFTQHRGARDLQNTDPCVFGGFRYTCCQQHFRGRPSALQQLDPASLILFGSSLEGTFVLDTMFVVADQGISHDSTTYRKRLKGRVPDAYFDITLDPWYADPYEPCRLFEGATSDKPLDGMFSFVPAAPWTPRTNGFERPRIQIRDVISDRLTQGRKCTVVSQAEAKVVWREVARQTEACGLWLGVQTDMPPRVS